MEKVLEILGNVGFDWKVALASFFNFLIILLILRTFFFKSIGKTLDERKQKIIEGLTLREEASRDRQNAFAEKAAILEEARQQESAILQEAHNKAIILEKDIIARAEKQSEKIVEKADGELARLKKELHLDWQEKSPKLVVDMVKKVLGEKMTQEVNEGYIKTLIK